MWNLKKAQGIKELKPNYEALDPKQLEKQTSKTTIYLIMTFGGYESCYIIAISFNCYCKERHHKKMSSIIPLLLLFFADADVVFVVNNNSFGIPINISDLP